MSGLIIISVRDYAHPCPDEVVGEEGPFSKAEACRS